jgi:hypothetical protein
MNQLFSHLIATRFARAVFVCSVVTTLAISSWLWLFSDLAFRQQASFAVYRGPDGVTARTFISSVTRSPWVIDKTPCGESAKVRPWKPWLEPIGLACVEVGISDSELQNINLQLNLLSLWDMTLHYFFVVLPALVGVLGGLTLAVATNLVRRLVQWIANAPK